MYHLAKSKHSWQEKGYNDTDAELRAVREMGNATNLGVSLNQIHQPKIDWLLVFPFVLAAMCSFYRYYQLSSRYDILSCVISLLLLVELL